MDEIRVLLTIRFQVIGNGQSIVDGVADDRTGHAVATAAAAAELRPRDGDDFNTLLAQERIGICVETRTCCTG